MRNKFFLPFLLAAGLVLFGGLGISQAGNLNVNGFADIILTLSDEASDDTGLDADGTSANSTEKKTTVAAEVDFEYTTEGPVTFRLDLDIPSIGNEATGVLPTESATVTHTGGGTETITSTHSAIGIEQAKFMWAIPGADQIGLTLTGGAFNAPIGFEAQDAPDLYQTSNGQLFGLVPSNLAGLMLSAGTGPVALDVYFANEWRLNQAEENSFGGLLTIAPIEGASLAVGYITSPEQKVAGTAVPADENTLDIVLTGELSGLTVTPNITDLVVLGSFEYLTDENNDAFAIVVNVTHNTPSFPHGLTIRYDSVDCDAASVACGAVDPVTGLGVDSTPTSLTVALFTAISDNLTALVEWKSFDPDVDDDPATTPVDEGDSSDLLTLEFVATF